MLRIVAVATPLKRHVLRCSMAKSIASACFDIHSASSLTVMRAACVSTDSDASADALSTRCGFLDFRLERGAFRLIGKRLFLKCSHSLAEVPVGMNVPLDPDLLRKDLLNCKVIGMNMIRSFNGLASRRQLDLCDELGLLVFQENYAAWLMEPSSKLPERFQQTTQAMVNPVFFRNRHERTEHPDGGRKSHLVRHALGNDRRGQVLVIRPDGPKQARPPRPHASRAAKVGGQLSSFW